MGFANMSNQSIQVPVCLNPETISDLYHQFELLDLDTAHCIFLKSQSKDNFCLGLDVHWASEQDNSIIDMAQQFVTFLNNLRTSPCIAVAIADGAVVGAGLGIVSACDLVLSTCDSSFQLTEGLFGLVPGTILPFLLDRLSPQAIKKMVFSAKIFSPVEAMMMGLVDDVTSRDGMDTCIQSWMKQLARCKKRSVKDLKFLFQKKRSTEQDLSDFGISLLHSRLQDASIRDRLKNLAYFMETGEKK